MKKLKLLNFGEGGIKGYLFRHVEKIVAGVVLVMVLWLLYSGYSGYARTALKEKPSDLMSLADQMKNNIDRPTWDAVREQNQLLPPKWVEIATAQGRPVEKVAYATRVPWNPPLLPSKTKRHMPLVYKAEKVEVVAGYGALAMALSDSVEEDPLMGEAYTNRLKASREKLALDEEKRKRAVEEAKRRAAEAKKASAAAAAAAKNPNAVAKKPPKLGDRGQQESDIGQLIPGNGAAGDARFGMAGMPDLSEEEKLAEFQASQNAIPKGYYFVSVTALVPYKTQWKEYQRFKEAVGYDPQRDTPKYRNYRVERQEQGSNEWVTLPKGKVFATYELFVADRPEELADPRYIDPVLTMPIPPIMKRDLRKLALHSEVPEYVKDDQAVAAEEAKAAPTEEGEEKPKGDVWDDEVMVDPSRPRNGRPGAEGPAVPGAARGPRGMRGPGGEGVGAAASNANVEPEVEYKLFRFYDFTVEPGKKYRYRVQLALEDPNNPKPADASAAPGPGERAPAGGGNAGAGSTPPSIATLSQQVLDHLKNPSTPKNLLITEYSDESPYASVPSTQHMLAGNVTPPPKTSALVAEPEARVLLTVWDNRRAVDVPLEADVRRGSSLDVTKDTSVVHPANLEVVELKDYRFNTGAVVVDMRGGDPLPGVDKKPSSMLANGEVLMMNSAGELVACDEMADRRAYRRIRPEIDKPKAAGNGAAPAGAAPAGEGPGFNPLDILGPPAGGRPAPGPVREGRPPVRPKN